jgi:hypothetical protein
VSENEPPPPYGAAPPGPYPPYGYGPPLQQSGLAVASMVTGIVGVVLGFCGFFGFFGFVGLIGIAGVICGVLAKQDIRRSGGAKTGDGMALAGIITGAVGAAIGVANIALIAFVVSSYNV